CAFHGKPFIKQLVTIWCGQKMLAMFSFCTHKVAGTSSERIASGRIAAASCLWDKDWDNGSSENSRDGKTQQGG
ncbi:MAG: hypothetical protein JXR35_03300, partial [Rhodobacteraceae bacterium]|nr:hypothetical protein [Paracoccaceae bacterium]